MPGYEKGRFVGLGDYEKQELTCCICREILCNPVVVDCCLQTFCKDCIYQWLETEANCPHDRQPLMVTELRPAPRILTNLLGKMTITCDYWKNGCKESMPLDRLRDHTNQCLYSLRLCPKCYCICNISHDCIKELMAVNRKESTKYEQLWHEKDVLNKAVDEMTVRFVDEKSKLVKQVDQLRAQLADCRKQLLTTKQQLSFNNNKDNNVIAGLPPSSSSSSSSRLYKTFSTMSLNANTTTTTNCPQNRPTIYDMIREGRRHLSQRVSITETNTDDTVANRVVDVVKSELQSNNNMYYMCQNIVYKLDHELGSSWCVITNYDKQGHNYTNSSCFVKLKFGKLTFKIYRTKFLDVPLLKRRLRDGKVEPKIRLFDTDMTESMIQFVENISLTAIRKHKTLKSIASELRSKMDAEYGGHWNCFAHNYGDYSVNKKDKTFASFDIDELKLTMFQSS